VDSASNFFVVFFIFSDLVCFCWTRKWSGGGEKSTRTRTAERGRGKERDDRPHERRESRKQSTVMQHDDYSKTTAITHLLVRSAVAFVFVPAGRTERREWTEGGGGGETVCQAMGVGGLACISGESCELAGARRLASLLSKMARPKKEWKYGQPDGGERQYPPPSLAERNLY
jgi:hypothetical protein